MLIDKFQLSPLDTVHPWLNLHYKKSLTMVKNQEKQFKKGIAGKGNVVMNKEICESRYNSRMANRDEEMEMNVSKLQ